MKYDAFVKQYGAITSKANRIAFEMIAIIRFFAALRK